MDHSVVRGGDSSLSHSLTHKEEIIAAVRIEVVLHGTVPNQQN